MAFCQKMTIIFLKCLIFLNSVHNRFSSTIIIYYRRLPIKNLNRNSKFNLNLTHNTKFVFSFTRCVDDKFSGENAYIDFSVWFFIEFFQRFKIMYIEKQKFE